MVFSTLGNSGMNFSNLSTEGYAAFVLAIIFSIVSVASIIYYLKHQNANKLIVVLTTMVFPVITVFCWVYLIMNVFNYPIDIALYVSLGVAVGYLLLAYVIALIINYCIKSKDNKKEENVNLTTENEEHIEETTEPAEPLLLTSSETVEEAENVENEEMTEEPENAEPIEQGVIFSNTEKKTFAEQLESLDEDRKQYFNEILEYAMSMEGTKRFDSKFHTVVKIGRLKLLDAKFAKEVLVCNFMAGSSELKNYSQSEKTVKIKEKPVMLEIDSVESVTVAKNMIDISYKNISDAHEEKLEAKKAERKKKKAEMTENAESTEVPVEEKKRRGRKKKTENAETTENIENVETPVEEQPKKRRGRRKKSEIEAEQKANQENSENE
ncbi:MAG: hypothetical protein ACI4R8_01990 [Candidatus Caccovivens sp.]